MSARKSLIPTRRLAAAALALSLASIPGLAPAQGLSLSDPDGLSFVDVTIPIHRGLLRPPLRLGHLRTPPARLASVASSRGDAAILAPTGDAGHRLRHVIHIAESRRDGYDAVVASARLRPPRRPTEMTLGEIYDWIEATPGQNHAIGRYQFIPDTLRRVARVAGLERHDRFDAAAQDRLADVLLREAGFDAYMAGGLDRAGFMDKLAAIWAGLPASSGRSHYHGFAGNRATISLRDFDAALAALKGG